MDDVIDVKLVDLDLDKIMTQIPTKKDAQLFALQQGIF